MVAAKEMVTISKRLKNARRNAKKKKRSGKENGNPITREEINVTNC